MSRLLEVEEADSEVCLKMYLRFCVMLLKSRGKVSKERKLIHHRFPVLYLYPYFKSLLCPACSSC